MQKHLVEIIEFLNKKGFYVDYIREYEKEEGIGLSIEVSSTKTFFDEKSKNAKKPKANYSAEQKGI